MLAHGLLVFRRQIWITIANNFPKAYLSNLFWHQFFIKQAALNASFILHKTGDYFVQIFTTNALRLFTFWLTQAFNFHMKLTRSEEHTSELQSRGHLVCRLLLEKKHLTGA